MTIKSALASRLKNCSVMTGDEYLAKNKSTLKETDLPGEETLVIEFIGVTSKETIFLEIRNRRTVLIPYKWRNDSITKKINKILYEENYNSEFANITD